MKILEVRDGFIKFESEKKLSVSSFLKIEDEKSYIAQVVQVRRSGELEIVYAKILFNFDGALRAYDKTRPSLTASISEFDFKNIAKAFESLNPVLIGNFIDNDTEILIDKNNFSNKILASIDNADMLNLLISNLAKQFPKTLVIDMLGNINATKFVAGVDFKLPLNTDSLNFMYEDCLNDATSDSKSLIKEIFEDLSEYSKTVPFLPFEVLKSIVDDMVDKSHVFKLLVLKNKLTKFHLMGYFASNLKEASNLDKILNLQNPIIDLSKLDPIFQNRYLSIIYSMLSKTKNTQVFVVASNSINKNNLKMVLKNENVDSVFLTHSKFKYLNELKPFFENYIIEPTFVNKEIFKIYSMILNAMNKESYLVVGTGTNFIPLVSNLRVLKEIPVVTADENFEEDSVESSIEESTVEISNTEMSEVEAQELEKALEDSDIIEEQIKDDTINVIEKKSEDLIEKVSEEIVMSENNQVKNIFSDDDDEEDSVEDNEEIFEEISVEENEELQETVEIVEESENANIELQEVETGDLAAENISDNSEIVPEIVEELPETVNDEIIEEVVSEDLVEIEESIDVIQDENIMLTEELLEENLDVEEDVVLEEIQEFHTEVDDIQVIEISEEISEMTELAELDEVDTVDIDLKLAVNEDLEEEESHNMIEDSLSADGVEIENSDILISEDSIEYDEFDGELIELDDSEISEDLIVVDLEDEEEQGENLDVEKEIIEDVDKVFTTMNDDSISDSDLDFIDELNGDVDEANNLEDELVLSEGMEELTDFSQDDDSNDDGLLQPIEEISLDTPSDEKEILETKSSSTPIVPVYDAEIPQEDVVNSDVLEQGDTVVHAKYGNGVVEKMIKYGAKSLYSINFDNVGRRLLDPTLTELKKV